MIIQMAIFIFMKTLRPGWLSAPAWGDIYMYMTIIFKHLSATAWPIKAKLRGRGTKVCINGQGNLTKMAAMAIN